MIKILSESNNNLVAQVAATAFETLELKGDAAVELVEADEEEIRAVNKRERNVDSVTDVLSFPMLDEIKPFTKENYPFDYDDELSAVGLGSILICTAVAERQAREYGHTYEREYAYLFLHGLLHLLGYDHMEESDKKVMREKEEAVLSCLNITR